MAKIEESVHIDAPPERVWEVMSDLSRVPEYVYFVREVFDISDNPAREGTTYKERAKPGPIESTSDWRITTYEAPRRQVHEGKMPEMEARLAMDLQPEDGGTRFTQSMDFTVLPQVRPVGALLENLFVRRKMESDFQRILGDLKKVVEGGSASQQG